MARPRPPSFGECRAGLLAVLAFSQLCGCEGDSVSLGATPLAVAGDAGAAGSSAGTGPVGGSAARGEWIVQAEPVLAEEAYLLANPTLTVSGDLFFSRQMRYAPDAHVFKTAQVQGRFDRPDPKLNPPLPLGEDEKSGVSSPAISADGSELWFGKNVEGTMTATDIWVAHRAGDGWSAPELVAELSSSRDDAPRPPGLHGSVMPLASKPEGSTFYQLYLAQRDAQTGVWGAPSQELLANVNAEGETSIDGFLSDDGLTLYFASTRSALVKADLFRARRVDVLAAFGQPERLVDIQADADERDPWLSQDGKTLYYSSNRTGVYAIYRARLAE